MDIITGAQLRMARGFLNWSVRELSEAANVGVMTIKRMEESDGVPEAQVRTIQAVCRVIKTALDKRGAELFDGNGAGPGVRLKEMV